MNRGLFVVVLACLAAGPATRPTTTPAAGARQQPATTAPGKSELWQHVMAERVEITEAQSGRPATQPTPGDKDIPLRVPARILDEISKKTGVGRARLAVNVVAIPVARDDTFVDFWGFNITGFSGPPVFGRSYEITPRKISSKAEPGGRHLIGEIRYQFPGGPAWARLDYVATFDMHMVVRPWPGWEWPEAVSAMIVWKGQWK